MLEKYRDAQFTAADVATITGIGLPLLKKWILDGWLPKAKLAVPRGLGHERLFSIMDAIGVQMANAYRNFGSRPWIQQQTVKGLSTRSFDTFTKNLNGGCTIWVVTEKVTAMHTPKFFAEMHAKNPEAVEAGCAAIPLPGWLAKLETAIDGLREQKRVAADKQFIGS